MPGRLHLIVSLVVIFAAVGVHGQNLLSNPESVEYDAARNRYLVSNCGNGRIIEIDSVGQQSVFNDQLVVSVGLHRRGDTLYVASNSGLYAGLVGFDLTGDSMVVHIPVPGQGTLNDITSDTSGYLYVTDYDRHCVYKIDVVVGTVSHFVTSGLNEPNGIRYEPANNRLYLLNEQAPGGPICEVNLEDSSFTDVVATGLGVIDGLTRDLFGNWYVSDWVTRKVYRFSADFSVGPIAVSSGHSGPADILFDTVNALMAVPNYLGNRVDFVDMCSGPGVIDAEYDDAVGGDGDAFLDPGETVELVLRLQNRDAVDYSGATVSLAASCPDLVFGNDVVEFGPIASLEMATNLGEPFTFTLDSEAPPQAVSFVVTIDFASSMGLRQVTAGLETAIGEVSLLVVDDCQGEDDSYDYYRDALMVGGHRYHHWTSTLGGAPESTDLVRYNRVIWFTGDEHDEALSAEDASLLAEYLDGGGNLLLSGQGLASQLDSENPSFLSDYLHSEYLRTSYYLYMLGEPTGQVFDVSDSVCLNGPGGATNQTVLDRIGPVSGGLAELKFFGQDDWGAVSYDGDFRVVFCSFGLEAVTVDHSYWTNREVILDRALTFLDWLNPNHCCIARGDINHSGGATPVDISDLVYLVNWMFQSGPQPTCLVEVNADGQGDPPVDISDLVYMVNYMFQGGPAPVPCP